MSLYESNPEKATRLSRERGELAKDMEKAETEWLEASQAYEAARI